MDPALLLLPSALVASHLPPWLHSAADRPAVQAVQAAQAAQVINGSSSKTAVPAVGRDLLFVLTYHTHSTYPAALSRDDSM
jgi:proteasome lid subunit RPN8/RPN11